MKRYLLSGAALMLLPAGAYAACPPVTVADMQGVAPGAWPQQFDKAEFEAAASCEMAFAANPESEALNGEIAGNGPLPPLAERLPEEPLVLVPYDSIGQYGGTFHALSNATEAGTSDFLSIRHVNLMRYSDDLETIVPNVAKAWEWNEDYTKLTVHLRKGHKWSDGEPFTSADVKFWYDNLMLDPKINETPKDYALVAGERMTVETPDETTVIFNLPAPKPGLIAHFATTYAPAFQPVHFLGKFHPAINPDAILTRSPSGLRMVMTPFSPITVIRTGRTRQPRCSPARRLSPVSTARPCRRWKAISTPLTRRKGAPSSPILTSSRSIRRAISFPIFPARMSVTSTTIRSAC